MELPLFVYSIRPETTRHVDDLDKRWYVRDGDAKVGALCENMAAKYPQATAEEVLSSAGVHYTEVSCAQGYVYYQLYQWSTCVAAHHDGPYGIITGTWERDMGWLPIFTSPNPLDGIRPGEKGESEVSA